MGEKELQELFRQIEEQYNRVQTPLTQNIELNEIMLPVTPEYRLRTIISKPADLEGPFPTIVIRNCYVFAEPLSMHQARELAKRGFAVVVQWTRGINGSEGIWEPYIYERSDGAALMNWLQEQEWVKNIGLVGASYLALVGWSIADILPDKVKTMYLTVLGTEWHESLWQEGAFRQDVYTSWLMENARDDVKTDYMTSAKYRPQVNVDTDLWKARVQVYRDFITHPAPSDPYWTQGLWGTLEQVPSKMNIPVFIGEGWYDIHLGNMLRSYGKLADASRLHSVVQVNPGNHPLVPVIPGQKHQEHAAISEYEQQIRWFTDILVKGEIPEASVNYYVIGKDEWRSYPTWPTPVTGYRYYFLNGDALSQQAGPEGVREYDYDPDDPVASYGSGTLFYTAEGVGSLKQPGPNYRKDVLSYVSEPVSEDLDIVGQIKTKLWIESDAADTCFTAKLMEVNEDGEAYNIRDGITTLGFRNGAKTRQEYEGGPLEITISFWEVAFSVRKGSRLRLDISSSNFPEYSVHPNTQKVWSEETDVRVAHQKILSGKKYPSCVILPLDERA